MVPQRPKTAVLERSVVIPYLLRDETAAEMPELAALVTERKSIEQSMPEGSCKPCAKNKKMNAVVGAFAALVVQLKDDGDFLQRLRASLLKHMNRDVTEFILFYRTADMKTVQSFRF